MERELVLRSVEDGAILRMTCPDESWGSVTVEAQGHGYSVITPVYVDMASPLPEFLEDLGAGAGTRGPKQWETMEGELRFEASRDITGHIYLVYHLRSPDVGSKRWWTFTGRMVFELGAMPEVCKLARRFWNAAT